MERTFKRQKRVVGDIVKIPLENGFHTYARVLETTFAFYNFRTKDEIALDKIINSEILFITCVYNFAVTKGFWLKMGKILPLEENLINIPPFYRQDILNPHKFELIFRGFHRAASKEECLGLESWTVWSPEGIEKRLNDFYAGRENFRVKYMKNADIASYLLMPISEFQKLKTL